MNKRKRNPVKLTFKNCLLSVMKGVKICLFFARKHLLHLSPATFLSRFILAPFTISGFMIKLKTNSKKLLFRLSKAKSSAPNYGSCPPSKIKPCFFFVGNRKLSCSVRHLSGRVRDLSGYICLLSGRIRVLSGNIRLLSWSVRRLSGNIRLLSGFSLAGINDSKQFVHSRYLHPPARMPPGCCAISV